MMVGEKSNVANENEEKNEIPDPKK